MRFVPPVRIAAPVLWLPAAGDREIVRTAVVGAGAVSQGCPGSTDRATAPPQMAVFAGRRALSDAAVDPLDLSATIHAWTHHQGHGISSPAHYVARGVGALHAVPLGIQQMCNGGAAGIEVGAARILADPHTDRVLVTTADRFAAPEFGRRRGDDEPVCGDGATAVLVDRHAGPYALLSMASTAAPSRRAGQRTSRTSRTVSMMPRRPRGSGQILMANAVRSDLRSTSFADATGAAIRSIIVRCLTEAGLAPGDRRLRYVVLPRLGHNTLDRLYRPAISELTSAKVLDFGAETGHLGAGDAAANLADIHRIDLLYPGEIAILLSTGAGPTWSCLLIQADEGDRR
jgi:3-oxoacyl-[acyl-carrier-protein] synthase III